MILGVAVLCWQVHRRASATPPNPGALDVVAFHRAALARQRDALASVGRWYIGPLLPGFAILFAGGWIDPATDKLPMAIGQAIVLLLLAVIIWFNHRGAAKLQREIDNLDKQTR